MSKMVGERGDESAWSVHSRATAKPSPPIPRRISASTPETGHLFEIRNR
jgi:hypothetical protein